jgi:dienelactone hydrolase
MSHAAFTGWQYPPRYTELENGLRMTITRTTSITDSGHSVTYVDAGVTRTVARTIEVRVFAPDAPGTYPVILYSHGMGGSPFANSANIASALAALGYIVIAPTHLDSFRTPAAIQDDFYNQVGPAAIHRVADIQFLLSNAAAVTAGLAGYGLNLSDPTIAGHSLGAFTAQLLTGVISSLPEIAGIGPGNPYGITAVADPRFQQVIQLSPQGIAENSSGTFGLSENSWDGQHVPLLTITGTLDNGFDNQGYHDRLEGFDGGPGQDRHAIVIAGADHVQIGGDNSNAAAVQEVIAAASLFLQAYVGNSAAALATLSDVGAYRAAHPLVSEAYVRDGYDWEGSVSAVASGSVLTGLSTDDVMTGSIGADTLLGGFGDDTLAGGEGNDVLTGGSGRDLYRYRGFGDQGDDVITDFNALLPIPNEQVHNSCRPRYRDADAAANRQEDHIDLSTTGYTAASLGSAIQVTAMGGNTVISFVGGALTGTTITLVGVSAASINAADFFF